MKPAVTEARARVGWRIPALGGPGGRLRVAVAAVVLSALGALIAGFGGAYDDFAGRADGNRGLPLSARDLSAAYATDLSRSYVVASRDLVPLGASFAVETGDKVEVSTQVSIYAARGYLQFQLLPRRLVAADQADWLLCYGCDPAAFASRFDVVWDEEPGLAILKARA